MQAYKTRKAARRARNPFAKRAKGQQPLRQPSGQPAGNPTGPSFFSALKLQPYSGAEVFCKMGGLSDHQGLTAQKLYSDLKASFMAALQAWCPESGRIDKAFWNRCDGYIAENQWGRALADLIAWFKDCFGDGAIRVNVAEDQNGDYGFSLYQVCSLDPAWRVVEVRKLYKSVRATGSRALVEVLDSFLRLAAKKMNIAAWWNGGFEDAKWYLDERMEEIQHARIDSSYQEDAEGELDLEYEGLMKDLNNYRHGPAAALGQRIEQAPELTTAEIRQRLKRIRAAHKIKNVILAGCDLIDEGVSTLDFTHIEECEYEDEEETDDFYMGTDGLQFWEQFYFLYEYDDALSQHLEEHVNVAGDQVGVCPPVARYQVFADRTDWERQWFDDAQIWPTRLAMFFEALAASYETDERLITIINDEPNF